jgi:hypothetical protein
MKELLSFVSLLLTAQSPSPAQARDCAATLEAFRVKIEQNYAGVRLEVVGERRRQHDALFARLTTDARTASGEQCFFVLDRYVKFFDDPHLFVFQSTRLDTAESSSRALALGPVRNVDEASARASLTGRSLDPIEGIWNDGEGLRVLVTRDARPRDRFSAVVLTTDTTSWPVGATRATITKRAANDYLVDLYSRNFALRHLDGVVHKEVLLRLSPGLWAREFPAPPIEGLVDVTAPRRPTLVVRGTTVIVSMASHDPTYRPVLDSLVTANRDALNRAENLIIDLRGNEGGGAFTSAALHPYIRSTVPRTHRYASDTAWMLSSPDQIVYARRGFGSDTSLFVRTLLSRLTGSPGQLVPMPPFNADARGDTLTPGPSRIGVIVDGGTVSAGESLVLRALQSRRATVFGQPTAGALDYASVNVVRVLPDESRWLLGYGTITASNRLPVNGMREKGIAPDVRIRVDRLLGAIDEVERRLRELKS